MIQEKKRSLYLFLMSLAVCFWGFDYVVVAFSLGSISELTLLYFRYAIGFLVILSIKLKTDRKSIIRKKDIPIFILCALTGQIGYFYCEYSAVKHIPVALITIILTLVPIVAALLEKLLYKSPLTRKMIMSMVVCTAGVFLVIGADFRNIFRGEFIGYLLSLGAVAAWTIFNFVTSKLHDRYTTSCIMTHQYLCILLILAPIVLPKLPPVETFTPTVTAGLLYLGLFSAGISSSVEVRCLAVLGPTITSLYSNFMPVAATFWGFIFLDQMVSPMQIVGGIIVIATGCIFIKEKGRVDALKAPEALSETSELAPKP